jgi:hypothetical protein
MKNPFIDLAQVPVFLASFAQKSKASAKAQKRERIREEFKGARSTHPEFSSSHLPSRHRAIALALDLLAAMPHRASSRSHFLGLSTETSPNKTRITT